ncbi:hypothetical protein KIW84_042798 [Lathyrus oleraceus]|uniref:Uncharacterized protein n=1 Tax=Pisum sativum TaxID=3888 RepID=A0A9D5AT20_PEA|nr:hypothetical protein KIW84_042798 [Pisum sativum]
MSNEEVSSSKRYGSSFGKKKDCETNAISRWEAEEASNQKKSTTPSTPSSSIFSIPVFSINQLTPIQQQQRQQQQPQQQTNTYNNNNTKNHQQQNFERKKVLKNLLQPRNPPQIPEPLPWWYKPDLYCAFHQGEPGHDIKNCYPLKYEVQKLVKSGMVSFEDDTPNVKANPLPADGNSSVNMVDGCLGEFKVFDVRFIRRSLVTMHKDIFLVSECEHDHDGCAICSVNPRGCEIVRRDIQRLMDEGMIQIVQSCHVDDDVNVIVLVFKNPERVVIQYDSSNSNNISQRSVLPWVMRLEGPFPYTSDKVVPYQYNATMLKDGQKVPLPTTSSVVSIADVTKVTRRGRVFGSVFPKDVEDSIVGKKVELPTADPVSASKHRFGESSNLKTNDDDEVLRLIKKIEFNVVEQLLQTPSMISVMSLLMNSEVHKEALQRVLEQGRLLKKVMSTSGGEW